ncbi:MAG: NADPH-dependent assimilatory sulfite reductase hemoprotein subunit [Phycisphaerae bacterium]|nr:NADPH-dependent assimilatory sulfite reductase hemoprotein subunit [Phycisphaerae bacterium]
MSDSPQEKESKVEAVKRASRHLRGTIAETLASDATHFAKQDEPLLKFHGTYQQDDRDVRHERRKQKLEEAYQFMVRVAIPGGVLDADQYLALDALAERYGGGSLRATTRQGFQFHGILKKNLKATIKGINDALLTTIAACGDVERNVMACPAPLPDAAHETLRRVSREIAVALRPSTRAYHEIWLNGEKHLTSEPSADEEPFYGETYLPRKFKTGVGLADDNCVDIYSYDVGHVLLLDGSRVRGFNVLVGGGMGMTHGKADTFAQIAQPLGFVGPEHAVEATRVIAAIFRDHGNRADRRHARLKYLIAEWGMERFREEFRKRASFPLEPWVEIPRPGFHNHLGRHEQGGGKLFYGIYIDNGRIRDFDHARIKTALREIVSRHKPGLRVTAEQNILLTDLSETQIADIESILHANGMKTAGELPLARLDSMACPALPTCGLAMADSERVMPGVMSQFEEALAELGLEGEPITIRMTGCPNGCARPYSADIGLVGRRPGLYHVYVGGSLSGDRLSDLYAADVEMDGIVPLVRPLLQSWAKRRSAGEGLGDFYQRLLQRRDIRTTLTGGEEPTMETLRPLL